MSAIERVTPSIIEVWLHPLAEPMEFLPGEYVLLEDADRRVAPRSYSIANAPRADGEISLLVTRVAEGTTSSWVHDRLRAGDEVILTGPYGTFVADPSSSSPCLYLAAGSGLAPIRALIEASLRTTPGRSLTLVLSARTEADVLDRERLLGWQAEHPQFRFVAALTRAGPRRRVPELLPEICPWLAGHEVFVAGSPGFVLACATAAETLGAAREHVHSRAVLRRTTAMEWPTAGPGAGTVTDTPIYTRTGDDGTTGLLFGGRTSKADPLIEVCGTIDEAVAALGLARASRRRPGDTRGDPRLPARAVRRGRGHRRQPACARSPHTGRLRGHSGDDRRARAEHR